MKDCASTSLHGCDVGDPAATGLWCRIGPGEFAGSAALFVDRDGVLIEDTNYVGRPEDLHVLNGAAEAVARCNGLRIPVVVVTNQSGIARGLYGWDGFTAVQDALAAALAKSNAHFDAVLACAHHGDGDPPFDISSHPWRKPNPGMLLAAAERMKLDLSRSWMAGDRAGDLQAARAASLQGGVLISPDQPDSERDTSISVSDQDFIVGIAGSLALAVDWLLSERHLRR